MSQHESRFDRLNTFIAPLEEHKPRMDAFALSHCLAEKKVKPFAFTLGDVLLAMLCFALLALALTCMAIATQRCAQCVPMRR